MKRQYTVIVIPEEDRRGYWVAVPVLPGCFSQGATIEEALEHVKDAIQLYLRSAHAHGEDIPEEGGPLVMARVEVEDVGVAEGVAV